MAHEPGSPERTFADDARRVAGKRLTPFERELVELLRGVEWAAEVDDEDGGTLCGCPWCGAEQRRGHDAGCRLHGALDRVFGAAAVRAYCGLRGDDGAARVTIEPGSQALPVRRDLRNHSPDGFEWGYGGSGPAQLALALLADALDDDARALALYQRFISAVVANLPSPGWRLSADGIRKLAEQFEADRAAPSLQRDQADRMCAIPNMPPREGCA